MLALVAMIVFILAMFKVTLGSVSLLYLGLVFLSAHFALTGVGWYVWPRR